MNTTKKILCLQFVLQLTLVSFLLAEFQVIEDVDTRPWSSTPAKLSIDDNHLVLYVRIQESPQKYSLLFYDLDTKEHEFIVSETQQIDNPVIDANYVVWQQDNVSGASSQGDICGYNIVTKNKFVITQAQDQQENPDISGRYVVWQDTRNGVGYDIYGYDLETNQEFPIVTSQGDQKNPAIHGNIVVWDDNRNGPPDIYGYNLSTNQEFPICICPADQRNPDVYGDIVVWDDDRNGLEDIYGYNLATQTEFLISDAEKQQMEPRIFGNIVAWSDPRDTKNSIYAFDLDTNSEFPIPTDWSGKHDDLDVSGRLIVWLNHSGDELILDDDVYGYDMSSNGEALTATEINVNQTISGDTSTANGRDITSGGYKDNKDIWYFFIPPESRRYVIKTKNSTFDPTLAIFDEDLVEIDFSDNPLKPDSGIVLRARAGKKYYIRIAGYDGEVGAFNLSIKNFR